MESLAVKYRPKTFEEVCSQSSIIKILDRQLGLKQISNLYLFAGSSGCGKTTLARIFANKINGTDQGTIEIDAASNNGVDNVRAIIDEAKERSLVAPYKIFIIDEVHMITTAGWNAFLKCLEEPPLYTIFIFCTTNPEKIPETIRNRFAMRFDLTKVNTNEIENRLNQICEQENFSNYKNTTNYIAKISNGSMRDAISMLEKCSYFSNDLDIKNAVECLGNISYEAMFEITNALIDANEPVLLETINNICNSSNTKLFIENYLSFVLDLEKYCLFKNYNLINIPQYLGEELTFTVNIEDNVNYFNWLANKVLDIKNAIRQDVNSKSTIEVMMLAILRR